jgi:hypothetical protein
MLISIQPFMHAHSLLVDRRRLTDINFVILIIIGSNLKSICAVSFQMAIIQSDDAVHIFICVTDTHD